MVDLHLLLGKARRLLTGRSEAARMHGREAGWPLVMRELVNELYELDLITSLEKDALLSGKPCACRNGEAQRRLLFFARSLSDPNLLQYSPLQQNALQVCSCCALHKILTTSDSLSMTMSLSCACAYSRACACLHARACSLGPPASPAHVFHVYLGARISAFMSVCKLRCLACQLWCRTMERQS